MSRRLCPVVILVPLALALVLLATPVQAAVTAVVPGEVVALRAPTGATCVTADELFQPTEGWCYFPIDLLARDHVQLGLRLPDGRTRAITVAVAPYPYPQQILNFEDRRWVEPSPEELARIRRESAAISRLWDLRTPRRFTLPLRPPLDPLPEGGRFGARRIINGEPRNPHSGLDFPAPRGTPVHAVAPGTVVLTGDHFFAGKSVFVDHGDGLVSMYFHLDEILVEAGQPVTAGTVVGRVGATGRATGPHLHFGIRWRGRRIDPRLLLEPARIRRLP